MNFRFTEKKKKKGHVQFVYTLHFNSSSDIDREDKDVQIGFSTSWYSEICKYMKLFMKCLIFSCKAVILTDYIITGAKINCTSSLFFFKNPLFLPNNSLNSYIKSFL